MRKMRYIDRSCLMHPAFSVVGAAVFAAFSVYVAVHNTHFAHNACDRLENALEQGIVGQELAMRRITESVCRHLSKNVSHMPLVLSLHGPPGVGKTTAHEIAARALYGLEGASDSLSLATLRWMHGAKRRSEGWGLPFVKQAGKAAETVFGNPLICPGTGCPAYKVIFGEDFINLNKDQQHDFLREAILTHAAQFPDSFIVIEEYDRLRCDSRTMLRQIFTHPRVANVSLGKAIVMLESNHGMFTIQQMLLKGVKRDQISGDIAHHRLKDESYDLFQREGCEKALDTAKFLNMVDEFIAFFHLDHHQIRRIIEKYLRESESLVSKGKVTWTQRLVDYLLNQVVFDGAFAVDGAVDARIAQKKIFEVLRKQELDEEAQKCKNEDLTHLLDVIDGRVTVWTTCLGPELGREAY